MSKDEEESESVLRITLEYRDLRSELEGSYDEVWRMINNFLKKIREVMPTQTGFVSIEGKTISDILLDLRNQAFFDEPKTRTDVYQRMKTLGKTDITKEAVSMALLKLTKRNELHRVKKGRRYVYSAPYIDH